MTRKNKILIIVLASILVVVLAFGTLSVTTYALYKKDKKAIIILPGLFASALYDTETGEGVWDPFEALDLKFSDFMNEEGSLLIGNIAPLIFNDVVKAELDNIFANDNTGNEESMLNKIAMGPDGNPINENVKPVPWNFDNRLRFGVINAQRDMYDSINERYGNYYDVQVFNYDFRLDNRIHAQLLEDYINKQGYTEVVLVSHSNGGQVAAAYLAKSQENRDKVSKYISYNSPYYGSFSAISILENVDGMISGLMETLEGTLLQSLSEKIETVFDTQFKRLLNMWTVYQLLPSYELLMQEYNGEQAGLFVDGERIEFESEQDLLDFYMSRPWSKNSEGQTHIALTEWLEYKDSLKVEMPDGSKVMSTTLVDTTYYSGMDVNSTNKVYYTSEGDTLFQTSSDFTLHGDGTVTLISAVAGETDRERIVYFEGYNHYGVNSCFLDFAAEPTHQAIDKVTKKNISWYYKIWADLLK